MIATSDGYVLQKGSCIHITSAESLNNGIKKKVEQSRNNGEIKDNILQEDKLFSSLIIYCETKLSHFCNKGSQLTTSEIDLVVLYLGKIVQYDYCKGQV